MTETNLGPLLLPYPGEPNYLVSVWGDVWSKPRRGTRGGWVRPVNTWGALVLTIRGKRISVGRMVLETFVGPPPAGTECCHNNGLFCDNRRSNLRWGSHADNADDAARHGATRPKPSPAPAPHPPETTKMAKAKHGVANLARQGVSFQVRLTADELEKLRALAAQERRSMQAVVREALETALDRLEPAGATR